MVTIGMNYQVVQGKERAFENACLKVVHAMRNAAGHSETLLFHEVNDASHYLIVSEWSEKSAFEGFIASDAFRAVVDWGKEQILVGRPEHRVYGG